jgi:hypothetical protein
MKNLKQTVAAGACIVVALLAARLYAQPSASDINTDNGIDVHALMQQGNPQGQPGGVAVLGDVSATRTCAVATFKPGDGPTSAPMALQSVVTQRVCHMYWGKNICGDQTVQTVSRNVVLTIKGAHELLPWETEAFSVCLQGEDLSAKTLTAAYQYGDPVYRAARNGQYSVLEPAIRKIATAADPDGVALASFSEQADGLSVSFTDKWASYYTGDMTGLSVEVKHQQFFPELVPVFSLNTSQPAGPSYKFSFKDTEHKLRTGDKYYVVWKFQRLGKVSTDAVQQGGRSQELVLEGLHN